MLNWLISNDVYVTLTAVFQIFRIKEMLKQNKIGFTEDQTDVNKCFHL